MFLPFILLDFPILILFYEKYIRKINEEIEFVCVDYAVKDFSLSTLNVLPFVYTL
jgi:hypothetical protein